jgi:hypothetical protein
MPAIMAKSAQIGQLCTQTVPRPGIARAMPNGGYVRAIVERALMLQPTENDDLLHVYALFIRPRTSGSAADRACRGFLYNSFSLAGYWGLGLDVITDRRHLQAA